MKRFLLFILPLFLLLNTASVYAAPSFPSTDYLPPQCEGIKENVLRADLNRTIQDFFATETKLDFTAIVDRQWQVLNIDGAIDVGIDRATSMVSSNAGLVNKFKSSWLPSKAEELTNEVTEIAFNSSVLKRKLNQLSSNVSEEISDRLEVASAKSSSYGVDCLQQFINRQYSQVFVNVFSEKIQDSTPDSQDLVGSLRPDTVQFFQLHKFGLAGGAIFVTSKITKKVTSKIINRVMQQAGGRVLGRIGSTLIPVVGEVVGGAMLAGDLIKSFDGALPEIQKALKTTEVKQTIREGITNTVEEELRSESLQIGREISNEIYAEWLDFQQDYRDTLTLAGELPEFQELLAKNNNLSKISLLVGVCLNNMGRNQLIAAIQDGSFERSLSLPEITYQMLETTHSLPSLVEWTNLAGNQIADVVNLELYKSLEPKDLDRSLLKEILNLKDADSIAKLAILKVDNIRKLLAISKPNLVLLSKDLSSEDLQRLAGYLGELERSEINQLVKFLLGDNSAIIKNSAVMTHIIQSREIDAALKFWETSESVTTIPDGIWNILTGAISWRLVGDRYGMVLISLFLGVPILLFSIVAIWLDRQWLKIRRWFQKSQPQPAVDESNGDRSSSSTEHPIK
jgi:hypothetical protein